MSEESQTDLAILVADKNMEATVVGLLTRAQSIGIRQISFDLSVHPEKDPGCLLRSHEFLRLFQKTCSYALVMFDLDGCGQSTATRESLEQDVENRLSKSGWSGRCAAIVLDPELEAWVWSDSPEVDRATGWTGRSPGLRGWLLDNGYLGQEGAKPNPPKEALESALRQVKKPRSSSIYGVLARSVGLGRCTDLAFAKFKSTLQNWFAQ